MNSVVRFIESIFGSVPHQKGDGVDNHINYCDLSQGNNKLELKQLHYSELGDKRDKNTTRICFISDTHGLHNCLNILPSSCDLLIYCGDMCFKGRNYSDEEGLNILVDFNNWVKKQCITTIVIGGNHDYHMEKFGKVRVKEILSDCIYLMNESVVINNISIYCTPFSVPASFNRAFQDENTMNQAISDINSNNYHIVVSHSNQILKHMKSSRPRVFAFGHFHRMYGVYSGQQLDQSTDSTVYICSSILDNKYCFTNPPIVYDLSV